MSDKEKDDKEKSARYVDYLTTYCDVSQGKTPSVLNTMAERNLAARAVAAIDWRNGADPKTREELLEEIETMCPPSEEGHKYDSKVSS